MVFGRSQAWFHSVEWQNMVYHTVICCCGYQLIIGLIYIDDVICTEIPDPSIDFELHQIVMPNMVHGPVVASVPITLACKMVTVAKGSLSNISLKLN